VQKWLPNMIIK